MNFIDKVISYINPQAALKREFFRSCLSSVEPGSNAGSMSKPAFKLWTPEARTADGDTLVNLSLIRSRSRDLIRNNPVAKGVVDTIISGVLGSGLRMISAVNGEVLGLTPEQVTEVDGKIEREFSLWAESHYCDIERSMDFYGLQKMCLYQQLEAGDVFSILTSRESQTPYQFTLNILEAEQCATPQKYAYSDNLKGGVKKDSYGSPVSYFFLKGRRLSTPSLLNENYTVMQYANEYAEVPVWNKAGFKQVVHLFEKTRPGQSRGVPLLAPVMEQLKQLERYAGAELMAAVISGMFTVFVHDDELRDMPVYGRQTAANKTNDGELALGSGTIVQLKGGKRIETVNPTRPNSQFQPFFEAIIKQISMGLNLPFEIVVKHFTSSYSASQGAMLEAWRYFRDKRENFVRYFCAPVYERFFTEAVAKGRIEAPGFNTDPLKRKAWLSCEWIGPARGMIDEVKEVSAAAERVALGISTLKIEAIRLMGQDWYKILPEIIRESEIIKSKGILEKKS